MRTELIKQILAEQKDVDAWTIVTLKVKKNNLYLTKGHDIENNLQANREDVSVTIFKQFGKEIGDATFPIISTNAEEIRKQLVDALFMCEYARKPSYSLPKKQEIKKKVSLVDEELMKETLPEKIISLTQEAITTIQKYKDIKLNGMEILTNVQELRVQNSNDVDLTQQKTFCYIETVLTIKKGKEEQEFFPAKRTCRLEDFNVKKFVKEHVKLARDVSVSERPTGFEGNVLLSGEAITEFFTPSQSPNPLITHASARIKHMKLSMYEQGKQISQAKGDRLTIVSNPFVPFNPQSVLFDDEGVVSKKVTLIQDNVFKNYFASKQYADYLNILPTGALSVIQVKKGSKKIKELRKDEVYEIVSFSSFVPNHLSGDFSAEIRLGYLHKDGKKMPMKGGMFTGNVFKLIEECFLSKETKKDTGYLGPKGILFMKGVIGGA